MHAEAPLTRAAKLAISQDCHLWHFFLLIYVEFNVIGTCMQIFKKIDREKNLTFFNWKFDAMFLCQTVRNPCLGVKRDQFSCLCIFFALTHEYCTLGYNCDRLLEIKRRSCLILARKDIWKRIVHSSCHLIRFSKKFDKLFYTIESIDYSESK